MSPCEPVEATTTSTCASSASTASRPTARPPKRRARASALLGRAVRDDDLADASGDEIGGRQVGRLARADEEDSPSLEVLEDALGELGGRRGHGGRVLADRRLRPHALADAQRLAEEAVERRAGRPCLATRLVGFAHLAEDLRLAGHHRVEPRGDPEEMDGGGLVGDRVERGRQLGVREPRESRELAVDSLLQLRRVGVDRVDLRAVARREHDRLGAAIRQPLERPAPKVGVVREQLPQLHRSALIRGADEDESHSEVGEGGEDEADEDDEQEAGEREVRGPAAAPARLPAENEEAPRRRSTSGASPP